MVGVSSFMKSIILPTCCVLSTLYDGINPSKMNWIEGNEASDFVSDVYKTLVLFPTTSCNISDLFVKVLCYPRGEKIWVVVLQN